MVTGLTVKATGSSHTKMSLMTVFNQLCVQIPPSERSCYLAHNSKQTVASRFRLKEPKTSCKRAKRKQYGSFMEDQHSICPQFQQDLYLCFVWEQVRAENIHQIHRMIHVYQETQSSFQLHVEVTVKSSSYVIMWLITHKLPAGTANQSMQDMLSAVSFFKLKELTV